MTRATRQRVSGAVLMLLACGGCGRGEPEIVTVATAPIKQTTRENTKDFGDYVLHFNALTTDTLAPEVARAYGIIRSPNRAMLNVTVLRKEPGGPGTPVPAAVSVYASNLTGQLKNMTMRQIIEGDAIYYIGELPVANEETLIFDISATPINETSRFAVRFQHQFFSN